MATDISRARESLEAGRKDEALVLLWNAVEPARLAGDEDMLREIAELARSVPRKRGREPSRRHRRGTLGLGSGELCIATG